MQDSVYEFASYMPSKTSRIDVDSYISHHISSVLNCTDKNLFSSAYPHLHLLYMTYVYVQLLRIATEKEEQFGYCWIGFPSQEKDFLKKPSSPFSFSLINEKSVFRFFRLIGFEDATIGNISKPVLIRNSRMHALGSLFCNTQEDFEKEIKEYKTRLEQIESFQRPFLDLIYQRQIESYDQDFEMSSDEIESNLVEQYMLSDIQLHELARNRKDVLSAFINNNYM